MIDQNGSQSPHLLSLERLRLIACVSLSCFLSLGFGLIWYSNFVNPNGYQILTDNIVFWEASKMALHGHPADAYDPQIMMEAVAHDSIVRKNFGWFYPPSFFLMILPLGLLTLSQAYMTFMGISLASYVFVTQRIFRSPDALLFLVSFSGLWLNLRVGQNGLLTASVAGAALLTLERRPVISGIFIGLLSIKPHLAFLFPVALLANRSWLALLSAAITASALMIIGTSVLGIDTLNAWLGSLQQVKTMYLETEVLPVAMASGFSLFRILGLPVFASYVGQLVFSAYAITCVWKVWRSTAPVTAKYAALATAAFLATPYVYFYDLAWLSLIVAWMAKLALKEGWLAGERELLVLAWAMPLLSYMSIWFHYLALVQLVIPLLLIIILRRAGFSVFLSRR